MAIHKTHDDHGEERESRKPSIEPRLLDFFKELYDRDREAFGKQFPKFYGDSFEDFSEHFEAMCSEAKRGRAKRGNRGDDALMQRSTSVGSMTVTSRGIGGDEEEMKLERFKVRTVDIDGGGSAPASGGGSGQSGPKPGGSKSK